MSCLGIYVHIPFCLKKCNYCDFCSFPDKSESVKEAYTEELCKRIETFSSKQGKRRADTVYFGGGTPTLLSAELFGKITNKLYSCFDVSENAEITVECNPATIDKKGLRQLLDMGVNRLSIGLQSADDGELKELGRLHGFEDFKVCFADARDAGFENISVDLMYGLPRQTKDGFACTLERVAELAPEHISAYGLKIEEGTLFGKIRQKLVLPDEDTEFEMYSACREYLEKNGYGRYEISNFAKKGRESRHNLKYWRLEDYVGFGVAAHSCFEGARFGNSRNIEAFLRGEDITEEYSVISPSERINEYIMLSLRLEEGISFEKYRNLTGKELLSDKPQIKDFVEGGFMSVKNGRLFFTDKGFFVSNAVISQLIF